MKRVLQSCCFTAIIAISLIVSALFNTSFAASEKTLNYEVLKYNTNDTSIANDYFNKPAKVVEKNGKKYVQITVNHSHWITGMAIEGHKENIINTNKDKDERTSEFEVSKTSGKVDGTISVYINEPVNGKPFKYDHHYNITYKFDGASDQGDNSTSTSITKSENGGTGDTNATSSNDGKTEENPQTSGALPTYYYLAPTLALIVMISSIIFYKKVKKDHH